MGCRFGGGGRHLGGGQAWGGELSILNEVFNHILIYKFQISIGPGT